LIRQTSPDSGYLTAGLNGSTEFFIGAGSQLFKITQDRTYLNDVKNVANARMNEFQFSLIDDTLYRYTSNVDEVPRIFIDYNYGGNAQLGNNAGFKHFLRYYLNLSDPNIVGSFADSRYKNIMSQIINRVWDYEQCEESTLFGPDWSIMSPDPELKCNIAISGVNNGAVVGLLNLLAPLK
jgi:hypothetical protein